MIVSPQIPFGAIISGIDFSNTISAEDQDSLRNSLIKYKVISFQTDGLLKEDIPHIAKIFGTIFQPRNHDLKKKL